MIYTICYGIYIFVGIVLVINLLLSGVRPTKTLAWLLVILIVPVGGMILYLGLGLNRRKYKFFKLKRNKAVEEYLKRINQFSKNIESEFQLLSPEIQENNKLATLIIKNSNFIPYGGNKVRPLKNGPATFDAIFKALEQAKDFIHLQYYIYEEGELVERFTEIFEEKIKQGVNVRLIYDEIGSYKLSSTHLQHLQKIGVQVCSFLPMRFGRTFTALNYRNHRKIIIVDGKIGFTGGINISDKYIKGDPVLGTWHDMHLRLEGPAVNSLHGVFALDWYYVSGLDELLQQHYFPRSPFVGDKTVQVVASGPDSDYPSVHQQYFTTINQAKKYVYIANSYIIPGQAILSAIQTSALGGVDVRLLIPMNSDNVIVKWSIRAYFQELLEAGVKIFLFQDGFLHSKVIISDDSVASIGTANLDIRSFEQNFEINTIVYDTSVAQELKRSFLDDCKNSYQLDLDSYLERPTLDKVKEGIAKIFSPIL